MIEIFFIGSNVFACNSGNLFKVDHCEFKHIYVFVL